MGAIVNEKRGPWHKTKPELSSFQNRNRYYFYTAIKNSSCPGRPPYQPGMVPRHAQPALRKPCASGQKNTNKTSLHQPTAPSIHRLGLYGLSKQNSKRTRISVI